MSTENMVPIWLMQMEGEKGLGEGRYEWESFLSAVFPERINLIKMILREIGFDFDGKLTVDLTLPLFLPSVCGYWDLSDYIAINPMLLLFGSKFEIAHVLVHENIHSGGLSETEILDESVTEAATILKMQELYGYNGFESAYMSLVEELNHYFGEVTFEDLCNIYQDEGPGILNKIIEWITFKDIYNEGLFLELNYDSIIDRVKNKWGVVKALFPRLLNQTINGQRGAQTETEASFSEYDTSTLLGNIADKLLKTPTLISGLLWELMERQPNNQPIEPSHVHAVLRAEKYQYLLDFGENSVYRFSDIITEFVDEFNNYLNYPAHTGNEYETLYL